MEDSIFTKIIKGEIPCHKVFEDDKTIAFLTINPVRPGHVLVVPKKQVDSLWDLDAADYDALMHTSKRVAQRIQEVLQPKRVVMHVAGFEVPHAHIHLSPANSIAEFWQQPTDTEPDHTALAEMAKKLAF